MAKDLAVTSVGLKSDLSKTTKCGPIHNNDGYDFGQT
jgi:hypothetical protein